jgi:hypothetical protein
MKVSFHIMTRQPKLGDYFFNIYDDDYTERFHQKELLIEYMMSMFKSINFFQNSGPYFKFIDPADEGAFVLWSNVHSNEPVVISDI